MTIARSAALAAMYALLAVPRAGAQGLPPIDFDKLPRKEAPAPPKAAARRVDTVFLARIDTLRLERIDTVKLRRVDTLIVRRTDTLKLERIDTVKAAPAPQVAVAPGFTASGLTQVMFTGGDAVRTTYRLRRVELKVTADLGKRAQAILMVDAAKSLSLNTSGTQPTVTQSSRMLQDAFITMPVRGVTIDAGQQRLPLGYEGSMGSSGLETIERALMESDRSRGASLGDVRDAGVSVRQAWSAVDYRMGVFNGSGETMNEIDKQVGKAVVGQLSFHPKSLSGFRVGVSGATSGSSAADNPTRDRIGADVRLARGPIAIQVESMVGQDGATRRLGGYALATVAPRPRLKLVARVDAWDPDRSTDTTAATVAERDYLGGFTWLPAGTRLKVQLNVVRRTYTAGILPSSTLVLSQLQASW